MYEIVCVGIKYVYVFFIIGMLCVRFWLEYVNGFCGFMLVRNVFMLLVCVVIFYFCMGFCFRGFWMNVDECG